MSEVKIVHTLKLFIASVACPTFEEVEGGTVVSAPHYPIALWARNEFQAEAFILANLPDDFDTDRISIAISDVTGRVIGIAQNLKETDVKVEPTIPDREL